MLLVELLESTVKDSIVFIIDGALNACKELTKFIIILLLLYYLASRAFEFLEEVFGSNVAIQINENILPGTSDGNSGRICDQISDSKSEEPLALIESDLVKALEIEAEFEENRRKQLSIPESEGRRNIRRLTQKLLAPTDSDEGAIATRDFISLTTQASNETSRASQTVKTSLGKKSIPRDTPNLENTENTEGNIEEEEETESQPLTMEQLMILNRIKNEPESFDDQHDHESFHRV